MKTLAILDLETTTLDPATGHVVEVAICLYSLAERRHVRERSWLVKAPLDEVEASQHIHGVTPGLVSAYGVDLDDVWRMLHGILTKECHVACSHNAAFDTSWMPPFVANAVPFFCTCDDIAWPKPSTSRSLLAIAVAHGVAVDEAHRALEDVRTLRRLFTRSVELGADLPAMLARAMRPKVKVVAVTEKPWDMKPGEWDALKTTIKSAGFHWDDPSKSYWRTMPAEDIGALPFAVREVA